MNNVIELEHRRKSTAKVKSPCPDAPRFFCLHCDNDHFKLYADQSVHCASCGARIRNVTTKGQ